MITECWYDDNGTLVRTNEFEYDGVGNIISASDSDSQYVMTYDALNRMTSIDNAGTPDAPHLELTHTYDVVGNQLSTTDNYGVTVTSTYNSRNLLESQTWTGGDIDPLHVQYDYNERGQESEVRRYNDSTDNNLVVRTVSEYDDRGRMTDHTHLNALDEVLADYDYVWDNASRLISETHHDNTTDYSYDKTNQLLSALYTDPSLPDEFFDWDANGNPKGSEYLIGPDNQLLEDSDYIYQYDLVGNLRRKTSKADGSYTTYDYDNKNRLVLVTEYSAGGIITSSTEYTYDVFGRRIALDSDQNGDGSFEQQERFAYNGDNTWLDADESGVITTRYLASSKIDDMVARHRAGEGVILYLADHLGSVRDLADTSGQVVNHVDYSSFGTVLGQTNAGLGDRFLFQGRELDSSTGQYYFRTRYYDPTSLRFLSQDRLSFRSRDTNLYRFLANSPSNYLDPRGTEIIAESKFQAVLLGIIGGETGYVLCIWSVRGGGISTDELVYCVIVGIFTGVWWHSGVTVVPAV